MSLKEGRGRCRDGSFILMQALVRNSITLYHTLRLRNSCRIPAAAILIMASLACVGGCSLFFGWVRSPCRG